MTVAYRIERLGPEHDRTRFDCGVDSLTCYFREQASQDVRRKLSTCFAAVDHTEKVVGFYTFAAASIPAVALPGDVTRKLPRYPTLPAGLVGRLAVDRSKQGDGLGGDLIVDAIGRATRPDPAIFTLLVEAKNEAAAGFYRKHGFVPLVTRELSLFLTLARAATLLRS